MSNIIESNTITIKSIPKVFFFLKKIRSSILMKSNLLSLPSPLFPITRQLRGIWSIASHIFSRGSPQKIFITTTICPHSFTGSAWQEHYYQSHFSTKKNKNKYWTCFCLATVLTISKVSASGFAPYFFMMVGSENSARGIKATIIYNPTKPKLIAKKKKKSQYKLSSHQICF